MIIIGQKGKYGTCKAMWDNGVHVGEFIIGEDGYYAYWPIPKVGYVTAYFLREVADKLDELNEDWDKIVQSDPNI